MKPKQFACLIALLTFVCMALNAQVGYTGPGPEIITVEAAKKLRDDSPVALRGKIEKSLGDENYLFSDDSGSIIVEIDDRLWAGISVNQNDVVEIVGEVDKGFTKIEVEASSIKKL
ncbi:MAG: NirD/YgiW/YdeI family stress tolerance protein [Campylobacteraceae bacterium]|nr:NirD/YgiW/YdeI family stress tolerance protein [Campylobacteraceae bacterium]